MQLLPAEKPKICLKITQYEYLEIKLESRQ